MRKIIEIKAGRNINLSDYGLIASAIKRIWTIYDEEEMWNYFQFTPDNVMKIDRYNHETLKPFHHHCVFIEDRIHDSNVDNKNNLLHYDSRVVVQGSMIKILVEYDEV